MSRRLARIAAFALALVMMCTGVCFAASAEIVSPAVSSVTDSDSFLISVKLDSVSKARISVYQQKEAVETSRTVSGTSIKVTEYVAPDLSALKPEDVQAISDLYTGVVTKGAVMSNGKTAVKYTDIPYGDPVVYENKTEGIGIYTKQLTGMAPGLYRVNVDLLGKDGKPAASTTSFILVKEKPKVKEKTDLFETNQGTAAQTLKTVIKNIFK
jgi:hypothetical protein